MSGFKKAERSSESKKSSHKRSIFLAAMLLLLATSVAGDYIRFSAVVGLANEVINWIRPNLSTLRITLIVGFGGSLLSIPFMRKRSRQPPVHEHHAEPETIPHIVVHPLMLTPRPARDSEFVIRKTKKRGRIARNRDGERLPQTQQE